MRSIIRTACALIMIGITPAFATDQIGAFVPAAEKVGEARYTYLFWDLYDITLYAPRGTWSADAPFALRLEYLRDLSGKKIADKSAEEIRNQGYDNELRLADWHEQMRYIFPDVENGASLTGVYTESGESVFYHDAEEIGRISDPEFGRHFFNIWLGSKTSAQELRDRLLGGI